MDLFLKLVLYYVLIFFIVFSNMLIVIRIISLFYVFNVTHLPLNVDLLKVYLKNKKQTKPKK